MRLPQQLVGSPLFLFQDPADLILALSGHINPEQAQQISFLSARGLPPIVSKEAVAAMLGINAGLVWSLTNRPSRHYRTFTIPKGQGVRQITAPKVALKVIQKWICVHLTAYYRPPEHVYGFVPGRSHIDAAMRHVGADWAYSADLRDFFGSTPQDAVAQAFVDLGYDRNAAELCAQLVCFRGALAQGSPASPVLSNICFAEMDAALLELASHYQCRITRYADDIVFSGFGAFNPELQQALNAKFADTPWSLAPQKELRQPLKGRIKIHGLLIGKEGVRLTKGYRNQIRAYAHVLAEKGEAASDAAKLRGHVVYARQVRRVTGSPTGISDRAIAKLDRPRKFSIAAPELEAAPPSLWARIWRFFGVG